VTSTLLLGDRAVNRIGFGAMHLTGPGVWGQYPDPDHAVQVLRRAVELGVQFIDTADSYGPATSEQMIPAALRPYPEDLVISTKGGLLRTGPTDWGIDGSVPYIKPCGRPEYLRQQVELSLTRLGLDCIPLYQLHSIDPTVALAEQVGILSELQQAGKIAHIGLSNQPGVTLEQLTEAQRYADIVSVESLFNIGDRTDEPMLRHTEAHGVAYIPFFPLGAGILTGPDSPLQPIAADYSATPSQLAVAWLLHVSPNTLPIPGTTNLQHLAQNLAAADMSLTESDVTAITTRIDALHLPGTNIRDLIEAAVAR